MDRPATSFTVEEVIDEARDLFVSFTEQLHPTPILLRHLTRAQDDLHAQASSRDMNWWTEEVTEDDPDPDGDPIELGPVRYISSGRVVLKGVLSGHRMDGRIDPNLVIVTKGQANRALARFAVSIEGTKARLVPGGAWNLVSQVILVVAPKAKPLTLSRKFELHNEARTALVYGAGLFMAARGTESPDARIVRDWAKEHEKGINLWHERISPAQAVKKSYVRDVF